MQENIEKYHLTIPQENIWRLEEVNPNTNINNIFGTFRINKILDIKILKKAINKIIETNDALRLRIIESEMPKQYIEEYNYEDLLVYTIKDDDEVEVEKLIKKIAKERLQILNSKLYDIRIIQNTKETCVCVKTHHIISDAWTLGQIAEQIKENYLKICNKEEIDTKPSYLNYIKKDEEYRISDKYLLDKEYWHEYVKELKCENQYEIVKDKKSKRIQNEIDEELYTHINSFCKINKISEYSFFLAIISIYFSRIFNKDNLVIGTPYLNRKKANKEFNTMGMFIATLPINVIAKNNMSFLEICQNINTTNMQCFRHARFPYYEIQKAYQEFNKENTNLYEIAFSYQINKLETEIEGDTGKTTWISNDIQSNPLLISYINHYGEHYLYYDYLINCMQKNEIDAIHERIINIIQQVIKNEDIIVNEIEILSKNDLNLLNKFNNTGNIETTNETIVSRFEEIVQKNKDKIALVCGNQQITYEKLNKRANLLCIKIQQEDLKYEAIPIVLDNNINFIVSILGILKSGNYYVPILPEESKDRMQYMLNNSSAKILISDSKYINEIPDTDIKKINIDDIKEQKEKIKTANISSDHIAYLIYTSGTTGNPKGVMMKHENIISLINSMNSDEEFKYLEEDIAISLLKHSFDASAIDIYSTLLNGGTLVLMPKEDELNAIKVVETLKRENVTRVFTVHKWIEQIQNVSIENNIRLDKLRLIGTGAEVLRPKKFRNLLLNNPNLSIYNTYGPTETTMFITKHKVTDEDIVNNYAPIGKLIPNTRAIIINKDNKMLPINVQGELAIYEDASSAKNIAKGYFNQNKLTNERFVKVENTIVKNNNTIYKTGDIVKINSNLELEFIGRKDDFVKVTGGYLISLSEIEKRIEKLLGENIEVSVISSKIRQNNTLILFFSKKDNNICIKAEDVKRVIDENITFYMKPRNIIELEEIPRNKNGKVDKKKLEQISKEKLKGSCRNIKPQTKLEQMIYDKVKKIVKEDFSITDDFEDDLGLDSLNITNLYIELKNSKITIQDLYNYSTVKDLANMMSSEVVEEESKRCKINVKNNSQRFNMETVLLTGVTGFVGVNLLKELVESKTTKQIYCIVREKVNLSSSERFVKTINDYFDPKTCERIMKKTIVVNGDLTREDLGVSEENSNNIKKKVTTIINCAANVKHIGKYSEFYRDNVKTVTNLLNICKDNNISLAHISTLSLHGFNSTDTTNKIFDENVLNINQTFDKSPYLISKYEAEQKILKAINNNHINAKIFRIGNIMPRISDLVFQKNFEQNAFMLAIKEIGNVGLKTVELMNSELYLTPVDECATAINIILNSENSNTIYHIESDKVVRISDIVKNIRQKYSELDTTNTEQLKEKLYENYNVGVEHLNAIINQNTNTYSKEITIEILRKLNFEWQDINQTYIKNIIDIAFKIK